MAKHEINPFRQNGSPQIYIWTFIDSRFDLQWKLLYTLKDIQEHNLASIWCFHIRLSIIVSSWHHPLYIKFSATPVPPSTLTHHSSLTIYGFQSLSALVLSGYVIMAHNIITRTRKAIKHFNCTQHVFKFKASSNILACHLRKQFCLAKSCIRKLIPLFSICHSDDQWLNRHIVTDLLN